MQSRSKKFHKSFDSYQEAIQKQLHDDFNVKEYLNQNQSQGNIEEYLKLFNSLQVNNNQKKKKYDTLQVTYEHMHTDRLEKSLQTSKVSDWDTTKQSFINRFQQTQIKTSIQIQVKNTLWNEIIQTKKSLNLLKGDIGHIVSRKQSTNILESKISKVKIVADDQFKRVSMAFSKDKQEIKERKDMQRKFNKKLKNVSMFESSSMNKLKQNYLDTMVRKKQMHDRLAYIEKVSSSIYQTVDKQRSKNIRNKNTLEMYKHFQNLLRLIHIMPQIQEQYINCQRPNINEMVEEMKNICRLGNDKTSRSRSYHKSFNRSKVYQEQQVEPINSEDLEMVNQQNLDKFQQIVKGQFYRLAQEIQNKTIQYDFDVHQSEQLSIKLNEANLQIQRIEMDWVNQLSTNFILHPDTKQKYIEKLKKFIQINKTIFILLQFIQKNLNYSAQKSISDSNEKLSQQTNQNHMSQTLQYQPHNYLELPKLQSNGNHSFSSQSLIKSTKSITTTQKNYISQLHNIYHILLKEDSSQQNLQQINPQIFTLLLADIQIWMNQIKNKILQGKGFLRPNTKKLSGLFQKQLTKMSRNVSKLRANMFSKKAKTYLKTQQEEINDVNQQYLEYLQNFNKDYSMHKQNSLNRHNSAGTFSQNNKLFKSTIKFLIKRGLQNCSHSQIANINKLKQFSKSSAFQVSKQANRIRFLKDLDKDYYKMIKSTIKMEKQNTRKNYEFQKSFNRTKYSSNDEILEEKRFQSVFSHLFSSINGKNEMKQEAVAKKSTFLIKNISQKRISKHEESSKVPKTQMFNNQKILKVFNKISLKDEGKKQASIRSSISSKDRRHLSLQMKDILNLV